MMYKLTPLGLLALLALPVTCLAEESEQAITTSPNSPALADKLHYTPLNRLRSSATSHDTEMQSCSIDNVGLITIYSENGMARSSIEVRVNGNPVGNLRSYYPDGAPGCNTPTARGIITIKMPAGIHTLEANSPNVNWPQHKFNVQKCECTLVPLT